MSTIGILGGMGPLATVDVFNKIIVLTEANNDNEHIEIIVENNTKIPDRSNYIINQGKDPTRYLVKSAIRLEMMGADVIIMPCHTAHYFYDEIVKYIDVPLINMVEETAKETERVYPGKKIGLLATEGTYISGIYDKVFDAYNVELIKPESKKMKFVMNLIYDMKSGKKDMDITSFCTVLNEMKEKGVEAFILGCTELPIAFKEFEIMERTIDPTRVLACSSIKYVGKKIQT